MSHSVRGQFRITSLVTAVLILSWSVHAAPFDKVFQYTQPDHTVIDLRGQGDEFYAIFETLDGYTVIFDANTKAYYYATVTGGTFVSSGLRVGQGDPAANGLTMHLREDATVVKATVQANRTQWDTVTKQSQRWSDLKAASKLPNYTGVVGNKTGLCLLVDFADDPSTISQSDLNEFCNADAFTHNLASLDSRYPNTVSENVNFRYTPVLSTDNRSFQLTSNGNFCSVKKYFSDASAGMLTYTNVVTTYIRAPYPKSYYNDPTVGGTLACQTLIKDIVSTMRTSPDYDAKYRPLLDALTPDGGDVIAANLLFAGKGSSVFGQGLWPHCGTMLAVSLGNGLSIVNYNVMEIGSGPAIGPFCHENAHMLCAFPDQYDTTYSTAGVGNWCLMGHGCNGDGGTNPAQPGAYLKLIAGWASVTDLDAATHDTFAVNTNAIYRFVNPGAASEYFLIESRLKSGQDGALPGSGMCIWHVDESGDNSVLNAPHYECSLEQADGQSDLEYGVNYGDATDPYYPGNPAAGYTNAFSDATTPSAVWWDTSNSGVNVHSIYATSDGYTFVLGDLAVNSVVRLTPPNEYTNLTDVTWRVTFSENVFGVTDTDFQLVDVNGTFTSVAITAISATSGRTFDVSASVVGEGVLELDVLAAQTLYDDLNLQLGTDYVGGETYTIDTTPPVAYSIAVYPGGTVTPYDAGTATVAVEVYFNEVMDETVVPTISFPVENPGGALVLNTTWSYWVDSQTYIAYFDVVFDDTTNNTLLSNIDVQVSGAQDLAGNVMLDTVFPDQFSIDLQTPVVFTCTPSPSVVLAKHSGERTFSLTFTFSKDMDPALLPTITFPTADPGAALVPNTSQRTWVDARTYVADYDVVVNSTTERTQLFDIDVQIAGAQDLGGHVMQTALFNYVFSMDLLAPTIDSFTVSPANITAAAAGPGAFQITVVFSEAMDTFIEPQISFPVENPGPAMAPSSLGWVNSTTYTATYDVILNSTTARTKVLFIDVLVSGAQDVLGNVMADATFVDQFSIDLNIPTVTSLVASPALITPATSGPEAFTIAVTFSEEMNTEVTPSITFPVEQPGAALVFNSVKSGWSGIRTYVQQLTSTTSRTWTAGRTYTAVYDVNFSIATQNTRVQYIDIQVSGAQDLVGNVIPTATFTNEFSIDLASPIVYSVKRLNTTPTTASAVGFEVVFSEPVTGVRVSDFSPASTGVVGPSVLSFTGSGAIYDVSVYSGTGTGNLKLNVLTGGLIKDVDGNSFITSFFNGESYYIDRTPPTVRISAPSVSQTQNGPVSYVVMYGGADSVTLSATDITLNVTGTAQGTFSVAGTGTEMRVVTIDNAHGEGQIGISIAFGTASDLAGNLAPRAGPSAMFTVDDVPPVVTLAGPSVSSTRSGPVTYTVLYTSASSITLSESDVVLYTTGTATGAVSVSGSGTGQRSVTLDGITGDGTLYIEILPGTATDWIGNVAGGAGPSDPVSVDNTPPTVVIGPPSLSSTIDIPVSYEVTYTDASTITLSASDIAVNVTGSATAYVTLGGSGLITRVVTVYARGTGTVGITLSAGTAADAAGNLAASCVSATFAVDNGAPVISDILPTSGPTAGGTPVGIDGVNFSTSFTPVVWFDTTTARSVVVSSSTRITCITPPHATGTVNVTLVKADGQTATLANAFTFVPPPTITLVSPAIGPVGGGITITIRGTNFFPSGVSVLFGANTALGVSVASPTQLTCMLPAGALGTVDVTVTNPDGQSFTRPLAFTYTPPPQVLSVAPTSGTTLGGTPVTVTGSNFSTTGSVRVLFSGTAASQVLVLSSSQLTCVSPPNAEGYADVIVVNPDGQSNALVNGYFYIAPPLLIGISVNSGPEAGGTAVVITGNHFAKPGARVFFGATECTSLSVDSTTQISLTTPPGSGLVDIKVLNPDGQNSTLAQAFQYIPPPNILMISPQTGTTLGGTPVTLSGSNFATSGTIAVYFGATPATNIFLESSSRVYCTAPAGTGTVDVKITNPDGQSMTVTGGFTFIAPPKITGIAPTRGSTAGGTTVTVTGSDFSATNVSVLFDSRPASGVIIDSPTSIRCQTPAGSGVATVKVVNADGQSASLASAFTYIVPPVIADIAPAIGPVEGGIVITVTGSGFQTGASVFLGPLSITNPAITSTQIAFLLPAQPAGFVNLAVINPDGQTAIKANAFQYSTAVAPPPFLYSVAPALGTVSGGTTVTLTGANFRPGVFVVFGTQPALQVRLVSSTQVTCVSPANSLGLKDVTLGNPDGQLATLNNAFTYVGPPQLTSSLAVNAVQFLPFTYTISATGTAPVSFSASDLPPGLSLTGNTISGTPSASGLGMVTLTATNPYGSDARVLQITINGPGAPGGNHPPVIVSPITPSSSIGLTRVPVLFTVGVSDPDGNALGITWDFGDGTSGAGVAATHTYMAAGVYAVTVSVSDGIAVTSSTLLFAVSTSDAATVPTDIPGNIVWTTTGSNTFIVSKGSIKLSFVNATRNALQISGTVPLPKFFRPELKKVSVAVGGVVKEFTLSSRGLGTNAAGRLQLTGKIKQGIFRSTPAKFTLKLNGQTVLDALRSYGVSEPTAGKSLNVPVLMLIEQTGWQTAKVFQYKATAGRGGTGK